MRSRKKGREGRLKVGQDCRQWTHTFTIDTNGGRGGGDD